MQIPLQISFRNMDPSLAVAQKEEILVCMK